MQWGTRAIISGAVEGPLDAVVLHRLVEEAGGDLEKVHGLRGKQHLRKELRGFNQAARYNPWVILVDLDDDECPPPLRGEWLPNPAPLMCFRIVVRQIEAWLLADRDPIASFLSVAAGRVPNNPETLSNAKERMVELARHSRRRDIRLGLVPQPGSGRSVGPAYTSHLREFAASHWRPEVADQYANSLRRFRQRLRQLIQDPH